MLLSQDPHTGSDLTATSEDEIIYPESDVSLIQYGRTCPDLSIPTYCDDSQTNSAFITEFIERARLYETTLLRQNRPGPSIERLLQLATSAGMETPQSKEASMVTGDVDSKQDEPTVVQDRLVVQKQDESQTQIPTQFLHLFPPAVDAPTTVDEVNGGIVTTTLTSTKKPQGRPKKSPSQSPTPSVPPGDVDGGKEDGSTLVQDKPFVQEHDESQTQIPTQFLHLFPPVVNAPTAVNQAPTTVDEVNGGIVTTTLTSTKKPRGRPKKTPSQSPTPSVRPGDLSVPPGDSTLPYSWCDCPAIYPTSREIVEALQDPGKKHMKLMNGVRNPVTSYPMIQKVCSKIYQKIQSTYNPDGLTKNTTRGRESLAGLVIMSRKLTDAMNLDCFFHPYAKNGQVYTITNNPIHCGLDIPLKQFQDTIIDQMRKARTSRTCNDGLRLALTLLDPKYRSSVSIIMANRKERTHSDINGDYVLNFFEEILGTAFMNREYKPPQPPPDVFGEIDEQELAQWDPNDPKIFEVDRNPSWLAETWKLYVKRKYKSALDRWNKDTGGGNGQPWSFVNFCDRDARWLVVVFLQDVQANYLLAANAGGRMPSHLQMECGFEGTTEISSLEENSDQTSDQKTQTKRTRTKGTRMWHHE